MNLDVKILESTQPDAGNCYVSPGFAIILQVNKAGYDARVNHDARKTVFEVSDQVLHKPVCTVPEKG